VRRSKTEANITSLNLYRESEPNVLSCASDSSNKTVHLFYTPTLNSKEENKAQEPLAQSMIAEEDLSLSKTNPSGWISGYETSFAKIYPPSTDKSTFYLSTVISDQQVTVITSAGNFYLANLADGKRIEESDKNFMD